VQPPSPVVVVKKYSNRRLYDTSDSRYITLDELAQKIRAGKDVRVVDAKSGEDLTQSTLAQIILESRRAARLLPVPLLTQLIRMGDDALAEFFSRYMSWALELYTQARTGAQALSPLNPFATLPFTATSALARLFASGPGWAPPPPAAAPPPPPPEPGPEPEPEEEDDGPEPATTPAGDIAALRQELEDLKAALKATLLKGQP
jgi:polyhydroxyalkanoate synthesis repressor PhaR